MKDWLRYIGDTARAFIPWRPNQDDPLGPHTQPPPNIRDDGRQYHDQNHGSGRIQNQNERRNQQKKSSRPKSGSKIQSSPGPSSAASHSKSNSSHLEERQAKSKSVDQSIPSSSQSSLNSKVSCETTPDIRYFSQNSVNGFNEDGAHFTRPHTVSMPPGGGDQSYSHACQYPPLQYTPTRSFPIRSNISQSQNIPAYPQSHVNIINPALYVQPSANPTDLVFPRTLKTNELRNQGPDVLLSRSHPAGSYVCSNVASESRDKGDRSHLESKNNAETDSFQTVHRKRKRNKSKTTLISKQNSDSSIEKQQDVSVERYSEPKQKNAKGSARSQSRDSKHSIPSERMIRKDSKNKATKDESKINSKNSNGKKQSNASVNKRKTPAPTPEILKKIISQSKELQQNTDDLDASDGLTTNARNFSEMSGSKPKKKQKSRQRTAEEGKPIKSASDAAITSNQLTDKSQDFGGITVQELEKDLSNQEIGKEAKLVKYNSHKESSSHEIDKLDETNKSTGDVSLQSYERDSFMKCEREASKEQCLVASPKDKRGEKCTDYSRGTIKNTPQLVEGQAVFELNIQQNNEEQYSNYRSEDNNAKQLDSAASTTSTCDTENFKTHESESTAKERPKQSCEADNGSVDQQSVVPFSNKSVECDDKNIQNIDTLAAESNIGEHTRSGSYFKSDIIVCKKVKARDSCNGNSKKQLKAQLTATTSEGKESVSTNGDVKQKSDSAASFCEKESTVDAVEIKNKPVEVDNPSQAHVAPTGVHSDNKQLNITSEITDDSNFTVEARGIKCANDRSASVPVIEAKNEYQLATSRGARVSRDLASEHCVAQLDSVEGSAITVATDIQCNTVVGDVNVTVVHDGEVSAKKIIECIGESHNGDCNLNNKPEESVEVIGNEEFYQPTGVSDSESDEDTTIIEKLDTNKENRNVDSSELNGHNNTIKTNYEVDSSVDLKLNGEIGAVIQEDTEKLCSYENIFENSLENTISQNDNAVSKCDVSAEFISNQLDHEADSVKNEPLGLHACSHEVVNPEDYSNSVAETNTAADMIPTNKDVEDIPVVTIRLRKRPVAKVDTEQATSEQNVTEESSLPARRRRSRPVETTNTEQTTEASQLRRRRSRISENQDENQQNNVELHPQLLKGDDEPAPILGTVVRRRRPQSDELKSEDGQVVRRRRTYNEKTAEAEKKNSTVQTSVSEQNVDGVRRRRRQREAESTSEANDNINDAGQNGTVRRRRRRPTISQDDQKNEQTEDVTTNRRRHDTLRAEENVQLSDKENQLDIKENSSLDKKENDNSQGNSPNVPRRRRLRRRDTTGVSDSDDPDTDATHHDEEEAQLSSTSNYGSGRYGSSAGAGGIGAGYLSVLKRDRSGSRDAVGSTGGGGYGSGSDYGKSGYSSGTGSRPYSSRYGSTDFSSKGIGNIASKFGETTTPKKFGSTATSSTATSTQKPYSNDSTAVSSTTSITTPRRREPTTTSTTTETTPRRRVRDSTATANDTSTTSLTRTRSRDPQLPSTNSAFESPSTYTPRYSRLNNSYDRSDTGHYERSGYNSGYASDAKSGYGSDYKSGYNSSSNYPKYQSYSRSNSTLRDQDTTKYRPSYSRESSYRPYSRENSFLGSDTGGGSSWRSRVYGTEAVDNANSNNVNNKSNDTHSQDNTNQKSSNKNSLDTSVFRDAIDKLTKAAKEDGSQDKKPGGLSPNAVKVLPVFSTNDASLINKAPADFTSASEGSDAEDDKKPTESSSSLKPKINDQSIDPPTPARPFRHLAAVTPLPSKPASSNGLMATPTFKYSSRYATKDTEILPTASTPSKWLRDKENEKPHSPSISPSPTAAANAQSSAANKDCRKSVLNMDINPAEKELMRKQQEEKREELRRLRRQRGDDNKSLPTGKPPISEESSARVRGTLPDRTAKCVMEEDEQQSSEDGKLDKPPVPPLEKTSSRSRLVERKHSKGKGDGLRSSGSFRRVRQSSQTSKTSSSSSSDSETENKLPRSRNSSFVRRRRGSKDELMASSGDSRPPSRIRTDSQSGARRSRNNSETICKTNSKSNISKSHSGEKSRSSSRTNMLGDGKLSLGPDIDIGETTYTFTLKKPKPSSERVTSPLADSSIPRTKTKKESDSSEDESSKSTESSESASEEGNFFSLSKSKSMKKSRSSFSKLPAVLNNEHTNRIEDLGVRTSPDGKENVSRNNSSSNIKTCSYENDEDGVVTAKVTISLPNHNQILQSSSSSKAVHSDFQENYTIGNLSKSESKSNAAAQMNNENCSEFQWPTGSPELPRKKIEAAIAENNGYEDFQWPSGSPELPRKNVNGAANEQTQEGYEEFAWPSGSPVLPRRQPQTATSAEGCEEFQWPTGSPELPRKRNVLKPQWDTETETEMTEMEQTEWEDGSPKPHRRNMPQVVEETEEEFNFEWPSSPEMSKRQPFLTQYSGYDTQNEMETFDWASSPDLPAQKNKKYVSQTQNIDELINDKEQIEDEFDRLEKLFGFVEGEASEKASSGKTSRRSSRCSEKVTDKEEEEEEDEEDDEEENDNDDEKMSEENAILVKDEKNKSKESLRDRARNNLSIFLGKLTNIDDIVSSVLKPLTSLPATIKKKTSPHLTRKRKEDDSSRQDTDADIDALEENDSSVEEVDAADVKVHDAQANRAHLEEHIEEIDASAVIIREKEKREALRAEIVQAVKDGLDDASLQVYREGDYCTYLDLDTPLAQQAEDIDNITDSKKNAIILRTQLSVRVHAIIEKLNNSEGRELRRALFSLKQIFQDDKDLVHAFVQNDGLTCLVKVGTAADQNYQNYILRALGQVMLYVDGMNGVAEHPETVQWLYSLIGSKYRLVVKTALKLLLVFVEYTENNSLVLVRAIENVDLSKGQQPWSTIMRLLEGAEGLDMELQTYAMTLINKTLNGIPDQDNYYDQTDWLEELGMEILVQKFLHNPNSDLDLLQQLTIYEAVLSYEDGDDECRTRTIDPTIRQMPRTSTVDRDSLDRRKSRRHAGSPVPVRKITIKKPSCHLKVPKKDERLKSSSDEEHQFMSTGLPVDDLGGIKHADDGLTPALRRRRERAERQRTFLNDQENRRGSQSSDNNSSVEEESKDCEVHCLNQQATWMFEMLYGKTRRDDDGAARRESLTNIEGIASRISSLTDKEHAAESANKKEPIEIKAAASVRELTEKMQKGITLTVAEQEKLARLGDITGKIAKAKEDLDKAQGKTDSKDPSVPEPPKKSENDVQWENLMNHLNRPLELCDMDFTDLTEADDMDVMTIASTMKVPPPPPPPPPMGGGVIPPPPPAMNSNIPPPPPMMNGIPPPPPAPFADGSIPPPPPPPEALGDGSADGTIPPPPPAPNADGSIPPAPPLGSYGHHLAPKPGHPFGVGLMPIFQPKKTKKTIKLFWNEVTKDPNRQIGVPSIWDEVQMVELDTNRLEHLFESRAKDINAKERQQDGKGVKELVVLDPKRSNVINIGMTKLPPPRTIKTAILKMDSSIINREGIEKLLSTMLPSPEEKQKIQEAAIANPEVPLGSAEQFLMMLSTISELPARLKLWLFKLDYENMEREVAEPLMDLKQGIADLQKNKTFKILLSILLSVGNFLNGSDAKGFQVEYLSKIPEVKDTVHKHSLLHHLCHMVIEKYPDTTDLYSEVGAVTRASKVDFDELASNIERMEVECKASWDYLKVIAKHDGPTQMKLKMSEFLADCAERIIVLGIIYRRVLHRFQRFMTFLGTPAHKAKEVKAKEVCGVISEFALEYRTCRERVQQQLQKKANHRERNKTRGKMIMEDGSEYVADRLKPSIKLPRMDKFKPKPKTKEEKADSDLRQLLNVADATENDNIRGKNTWRRTKEGGSGRHRSSKAGSVGGEDALTAEMLLMADGDDALLDSLVKTATQAPQTRSAPRDRKRSRHADRKSSAAVKKSRTRERVLIQELEALQTQRTMEQD